ncbi:MAG TPA: phosphotransferase [Ktedonobacterales bacterium]|jgi:Ser/Thr protein kinase RdoA (MazF antagonist)
MTILAPDEDRAIAAWRLGAVRRARVPRQGVVHRTLLLDCDAGRFALRAYRHADLARVEREHALIAAVAVRGIPAVRPVPLPEGGTVLAREGRFYALFPFALGRQIARARLGPRALAAMGGFLARLHHALAECQVEGMRPRAMDLDAGRTLAGIARLLAVIRARPDGDALDALERLTRQRAEVECAAGASAAPLNALPFQVIHGDYQEENLFFSDGSVSAIIDWDQAYLAPRAWEVVRVLDLVCRLDPARCRAFLAGYRAGHTLPAGDLDLAAAWYGSMRLHDLWLYTSYYLEGNERVARFIAPGPYVPFGARWRAMMERL